MTIPGKALVGKNARVVEGVYRDDYLAALNEFATVDEVLGADKEAVAKGSSQPVAKLVLGTLGRVEYEVHLAALVMAAAKSGRWTAVEVPKENIQVNAVFQIADRSAGYGHVVQHEGRIFLLPSALYLTYCQAQQ